MFDWINKNKREKKNAFPSHRSGSQLFFTPFDKLRVFFFLNSPLMFIFTKNRISFVERHVFFVHFVSAFFLSYSFFFFYIRDHEEIWYPVGRGRVSLYRLCRIMELSYMRLSERRWREEVNTHPSPAPSHSTFPLFLHLFYLLLNFFLLLRI